MLIYVDVVEREETITIDGYSTAKTIKGSISDMGKYIKRHYSESEGDAMIKSKEEALIAAKDSEGGYYLEIEEVSCASRWNNEKEQMEYQDANFYIVCRFVK